MRPAECNALRDWASSYEAAVRQQEIRQETTMAPHGTLWVYVPKAVYELLETIGCVAFEGYVNTTERDVETELREAEAD